VTAEAVQVWLIEVDQPAAALAGLAAVLDAAEQARAAALTRADHRRRYIAAHAAVRLILADRLGLPASRIRWQHGRHGKPELAGPAAAAARTSLSHCAELALLAVADRRPVGVDLQRLPARLDVIRMSARYYPAAEARFVAAGRDPAERASRYAGLWTRKEACVKAAGGRLTEGLRLPVGGPGPVLVRDPGGPLPGPYLVGDLPVPAGFHAAVAAGGDRPYQVLRRWWPGPAAGRPAESIQDSPDPDPMAVEHA
jgi:4'-phosphopantetheinyl transferase